MSNINEYLFLLKEFNKLLSDAQSLIGPNINQDINNLQNGFNNIKSSIALIKAKLDNANRILKVKNHQRRKKRK